MRSPIRLPQPRGPAPGRWAPIISIFDKQWGLFQGEPESRRKPRLHSVIKGTCPSLERVWVRHEGEALTNFRVCARGAEM